MSTSTISFDERLNLLTVIVEKVFKNNYNILNVLNEEDNNYISKICGLTNIKYDNINNKIEASMSKKEPIVSDFLNIFTLHSNTYNGLNLSIPLEKYIIEITKKEEPKKDILIKPVNININKSEEIKQDNKEEKKEEIINSPNESPIMETCGFTDKWSQENIKKFNDYMTTIKQNIDDKSNNQVSELARNDFNSLRLVGIKFSKNKKSNDMICVVANVNTCAVFEVFRVGNETEIHEFNNDEEYKKKVYERLDIASKKSDEEKTKYLNGYCRVDFKLLPTKKKSA